MKTSKVNPMSSVLPGAPWLITHRSMLGVNRPNKFTLNGTDYVLWQDSQGKVAALENICPHMQSPLSEGWICQERNTIVCPYHALEYDESGRLCRGDNVEKAAPLAKPLELIIENDLIWTYGGYSPVQPIPDLFRRKTEKATFMGVTGSQSIETEFLRALRNNYDMNHLAGAHRSFGFSEAQIHDYVEDGDTSTLEQDLTFQYDSWLGFIRQNRLLPPPSGLTNNIEFAFPTTNCISINIAASGQLHVFFVLYPETSTQTKLTMYIYARPRYRWLAKLIELGIFRRQLRAFDLISWQDKEILEMLYPEKRSKIKLPTEEVIAYAEKLYHEWPSRTNIYKLKVAEKLELEKQPMK